MRSTPIVLLLAVLAVLAVHAPAAAQAPQAPLRLTLEDAIARGLARSPGMAEAAARAAAAESTAAAREALGSPTVTAVSGFLRTNHVYEFGVPQPGGTLQVIFPDIPSNYRLRLEAGLPIYQGGRPEALAESARAESRAAGADRRAVESELRLAITAAYWHLVAAREGIGVRERALARTDAWVADVGARVDVGLLPPNDVLSARAERARQHVRLIEARAAAAIAAAELAQLIGVDPETAIEPVSGVSTPDPAAAELSGFAATRLVAAAQERRGEREAFEAREAALRATARGAAAASRPQVAAVAAVEPARPNRRFVPPVDEWNTAWDLGVQVTWTLFDGGRARAEQASAGLQADAVAARARAFDDQLAVEVRRRRLELEAAEAALAATAAGVTAATEARRVLGERFAAGVATSTDVLDAEIAQLEAELERTRLQAALRVAEARLLRAVGGA